MLETILLSLLIMSASLSGVFFIWKSIGNFLNKNLKYLVSFSAGVFLFITYLLMDEVVGHSENLQSGIIWIIVGIIIFTILFKFLPTFHHHHDEREETEHKHDKLDAKNILISDAVHNIGDGILLTASIAVSPITGVLTALSIFIHEFVQEISEFFVLKQAGFSTKKALKINFLVSGTILIGSVGSYFLFETFEALEIPLLALAAGSFLVVVVNDLIPHSIRHSSSKTKFGKHVIAFVLGAILMFSINSFVFHSHDDEHDSDYSHEYEEKLEGKYLEDDNH